MAEPGSTFNTSTQSDLAQANIFNKTAKPGLGFSSTQPHLSRSHISAMSEAHGLGFTTNTNAPLFEQLAHVKRKRDETREFALDVLHRAELEESNKRLKQEQAVKQRILELEKEAYMIEMSKKKLAAEADARAVEVAKRARAAREKAAVGPPYVAKPVTEAMIVEINEACKNMTREDDLRVFEIVRERDPHVAEPAEDEHIQLKEGTSPITISKVHDFVEAYYPKYAKFPTASTVSAPPAAVPATPTVNAPTPDRQLTPSASTQRQASPPRNLKNLAAAMPGAAGETVAIQPQAQTGAASTSSNSGGVNVSAIPPQTDATRLSEIHAELKKFRADIKNLGANNKPLKAVLSSIRTSIRKCLNQITKDARANQRQAEDLRNILLNSLKSAQAAEEKSAPVSVPTVDPNQFLATPRNNPVASSSKVMRNDAQLPVTFLYALNMMSKETCKKFVNECSTDPAQASFVGTVISGIFSYPPFTWRGGHFFDILEAKFRKDLPVVYNIRGKDTTIEGRDRIGWRRHKTEDGRPGDFIEGPQHYDRMTGLAAGFASLALRDYSKAAITRVNPFPPQNWWWGLTAIVDTPEADTTATHFTVLRFMIQGYEQSLFNIFGDKGKDQLFTSLVVFPYKGYNNDEIKDKSAVKAIEAFAMKLHKEKGLLQPPTPVKGALSETIPTITLPSPVFGPKDEMKGVHYPNALRDPLTPCFPITSIIAATPALAGNPIFGTVTAPAVFGMSQ